MFFGRAGSLLSLLFLLAGSVEVQAQGWTIVAGAGDTSHESVATDVGTRSAVLGIRHDGAQWLFVNGGLPLDSAGVPWTAAGFGGTASTPAGPLEIGIDGSALGHLYTLESLDARGSGLTVTLLPRLSFSSGLARAEIYSGPLFYRRSFDAPGVQESSLRTLLDSGARLWIAPAPRWIASADLRYLRGADAGHPYFGASLTFTEGPFQGWAAGGYWDIPDTSGANWSVGGALDLGWQSRLTAGFSSESPDPVYWNSARRNWSIGIERRLSRPPPALPVAVVAERRGEQVEIRIPREENGPAPALAGDFTDWEVVPMQAEGDSWIARFRLDPGVYHYAFVNDDGVWFVPDHLPAVDDGMGGESAILVVQ